MDKPLEPGVRKKGRNTFKVSQEYLKEDLQKLKNQKISKEKAIKDYGELSKGGQIKPVKAVAGVLAGLAAGVAPGIIGVGMLAKKKMKKKSSTVSPDDVKYSLKDKNMLTDLYQKATKQEATKMNKGGGMDMGAKKPLSFKEQLAKARAEGTVEKSKTSKYLKKRSRGDKINALLKSANVSNMNKGGGMDMGKMPNTVKPEPRGNPGVVETVVGKGGDYIKDLID